MKKHVNLRLLLCVFFAVCFVGSLTACRLNGQGGETSEAEYVTIRISEGAGYSAEGFINRIKKGTSVEFTLTIEKEYSLSEPTVKANGEEIVAKDGKYTFTAEEDTAITVENVSRYEVVKTSPVTLKGTTTTNDLAHPISALTNVVPTDYGRVDFASVGFTGYTSLVFFMKAEGLDKWLLIKNHAGQDVYANAIRNEAGTSWIADDVWHKVELRRVGRIYQLYVDGVKVVAYDNNPVNATARMNLNEFYLILNEQANYSFSELFGGVDESYTPPTYEVLLEQPLQKPFEEVEGVAPPEIAKKAYEYSISQWMKVGVNPFDFTIYGEGVFFFKSREGMWIELLHGTTQAFATQGTEWNKVVFSKDADGLMAISVNGKQTGVKVENLSELAMTFTGGDVVYVTDLYGYVDVYYVPPTTYEVTIVGEGVIVDSELTFEEGEDAIFSVYAPVGYALSADNAELISVSGLRYTFKIPVITANEVVTLTKTKAEEEVVETNVWSREGTDARFVNTLNGYNSSKVYIGSSAPTRAHRLRIYP